MEQEIYSQEFSVSRMISEGWSKYKDNIKVIAGIIFVITAGEWMMQAGAHYFMGLKSDWLSNEFGPEYAEAFIVSLVSLLDVVSMLAIAYLVKMKIDGMNVSFGQAMNKAVSKWFVAILTSFLEMIFLIGLTLLFIVPGIIYGVYWTFTTYAVVLQNKSGKGALDYSKSVVKGRWWKTLRYCLMLGLMIFAIGFVVSTPFLILEKLPVYQNAEFAAASGFLSAFLTNLVYAYFTVVTAIFFINFDATKNAIPVKPLAD